MDVPKSLFILLTSIVCGYCYEAPLFTNGRPRGGFVGTPYVEHPELLRNVGEQWFTQQLDHFEDSDTRTWKQRYFSNAEKFKTNGPVFLMVGGEGSLSPRWLSVGSMAEYAMANGALMLSLEHRFYGKSHPLRDTSVSNLKYLSSEQALADLATFRQAMVHQFKLSEENKWIIFGGSYPGGLSAWFRYKYPHLAHGAVASSAPMKAQLDFPQYLEVSTASLGSDKCRKNVQQATAKVESFMKSESGRKYLSHKFRTCHQLTKNIDDQMQFSSRLGDNFFYVIQYNRDNRVSSETNSEDSNKKNNINVRVLCKMMANKEIGDVVDRLAAINQMIMKRFGTKCMDIKYDEFIKFMKETGWNSRNAAGARQWTYQTCTEFGYFQTTDSPHQVFGKSIPLKYFLKQCVDIYGHTFNRTNNQRGINWSNTNYGGYALAKSASRIIFPNGSIDPWHALSFLKSEEDIIAIYINGTSHCGNMYPSSASDSKELANARHKIGTLIKQWLANTR